MARCTTCGYVGNFMKCPAAGLPVDMEGNYEWHHVVFDETPTDKKEEVKS